MILFKINILFSHRLTLCWDYENIEVETGMSDKLFNCAIIYAILPACEQVASQLAYSKY